MEFSPLSGPGNGYVILTEEAFAELLDLGPSIDDDPKLSIRPATVKYMQSKHKGEVIRALFGSSYNNAYCTVQHYLDVDQSARATLPRRILYNTISTDGVDLKVHHIDRMHSAKKNLSSHGFGTTVTTSELANLCQQTRPRSRLPLVGKLPPESRPQDFVGLDLGQTFTVGACAKGRSFAGVRNLSIKQKALQEPLRRHQQWLNAAKKKWFDDKHVDLFSVESACDVKIDSDGPVSEKWIKWFDRYDKLSAFYNSTAVMKRRWDLEKALRGEYDRAVSGIMSMVGVDWSRPTLNDQNRVLFVVGTGKFGSTNSLHTSFSEYFIKKVTSLGYRVLGVDEYFTSQKCPCCKQQTESIGIRVKYCRGCHKFFHRDVMAGENMVNAAQLIVETGERPEYLCRPSKNSTTDSNNMADGSKHLTDDDVNKKKPPDKGGGGLKRKRSLRTQESKSSQGASK